LLSGTMATCEGCCHLTGAMLNLAAEAADRARIVKSLFALVLDSIERAHTQKAKQQKWDCIERHVP
jgi:hypothetical protein